VSIFRTSSIGNFTRGGQTIVHFVRMISQVFRNFGVFSMVCLIVLTIGYFWVNTTDYERYIVGKWTIAKFSAFMFRNGDSTIPFDRPDGTTIKTHVNAILSSPYITSAIDKTSHVAFRGVVFGTVIVGSFLFVVFIFIQRTGRSFADERHIRGSQLVEAGDLKRLMKQQKIAGDISIAGVPLVGGSEVQNILLTGSPGGGKSVALRELIAQIRRRGDRAIIYSTAGDFIKYFYREGKDTILNPLDQRCPIWDVWAEGRTPSDFDTIAASLIPESKTGGDPFWVLGARTIFSTVAMRMKRQNDYSTAKLLRNLLTIRLSEAAVLVEGTEGAAIIAEGAEKTALSVRATLAAYVRSLKFLKRGKAEFSIRDWLAKDQGDDCIFISSRPDQKASLRPLITMWLDIVSSSLLSLPEDHNRRIWLIIDELPSLNEVPSLATTLAEGRKFGGCCVLGYQSFAQLADIYGQRAAETITGLCRTWVVFRANEPATAKLMSDALGEAELIEASEGISYGVSDVRDGVTLSSNRKIRPLLLPSELMNLPDLHGYIRLGADLPIGKFVIKYKPYKGVAAAFVEADLSNASMDLSVPDGAETGGTEKPESTNNTGRKQAKKRPLKSSDSSDDDEDGDLFQGLSL